MLYILLINSSCSRGSILCTRLLILELFFWVPTYMQCRFFDMLKTVLVKKLHFNPSWYLRFITLNVYVGKYNILSLSHASFIITSYVTWTRVLMLDSGTCLSVRYFKIFNLCLNEVSKCHTNVRASRIVHGYVNQDKSPNNILNKLRKRELCKYRIQDFPIETRYDSLYMFNYHCHGTVF